MTASRQEGTNPFTISKNGQAPAKAENRMKTSQDVINEQEQALAADRERLVVQEAQLKEAKDKIVAEERQEKVEKRNSLLDDAADWREMARTAIDAEKGKDYLRRAKDAETEATQLGVELNLVEATPAPVSKLIPKAISTSNALWTILGLFLTFCGATWYFGQSIIKDPMNAMGQSMLVNAAPRGLLAFTLTFATFLVSVFFIRVAFPQFYRIWHNRIDSERSLESLINEAPAWVVLACLLGLFYTFMQVFASYYQAMYA
ncbi:hypothetical protein [Fibrella aquatilis]|uniref:Uncharacterized protein n=1 Tax=Fibrella aquatilis TaxID=2817059 RepID=A0A939G9X5_9BACT|nr:hypothetical protein [Fibrella aquatilis]MBO0933928.1 hypothetical protein [Fibrella aquatilis]